ncbi:MULTISPECIES: acyltransferase family protein [Clostridium]|uniref:acyltransferase family protein n=1 Tax=Clostridium TaxID=1485 RepID=UPI000A177238|nr:MULTISPECIES: acyltransferase family protein [Clostridium]MBN1036872.1 hypothetical protein [Clostridium botulinum]MBY7026494.1 acyltransferase family protein [Clostridium botulinum]
MKYKDMKCLGKSNRVEYVDIFRGIAIIFMIIGHIGFGRIFDRYIHMFHMPLWFFISGWFYKNKDQSVLIHIGHKFKSLIIPYIIFGVVQYPIWVILNYNISKNLLEPFINFLWINTNLVMPIAGALWFLTCLFFTDNFFYIIQRVIRNRIYFCILIVLFSITGTFYKKIFSFRLPWAIDTAFVALGFYYIGYEFKRNKHKKVISYLLNMPINIIIFGFIANLILCFINGYVNLRTLNYSYAPLFWINAIIAILVYLNISRRLERIKIKFIIRICNYLKYIGKNSLIYLCLNQLVILFLSKIINISNCGALVLLIGHLIILIITLILLFLASELITKNKLKFIIGKF